MRNILVIKLLVDEKVSYDTISHGYIEYIQKLKNEQTKEYDELQGYVHRIFVGKRRIETRTFLMPFFFSGERNELTSLKNK
jgi:hypothetical protein